ncbi:alpha/beta hydrolase [Paracoccus sp. p4-l81]|uniref:alpha/beta hydrolase n=1 Tax=Paracoccus sp. p4-l81 TaxID=3342806 RepID=UPI0035BB7F39
MSVTDILTRTALRAMTRLPGALVARLAGTPVQVDGQRLDPLVQLLLRASGQAEDRIGSVDELRADFDRQGDWLAPQPQRPVARSDLTLPGGAGPRPVRRYRPQGISQGAVLFLHGGGYVGGSIASHDAVCAALADRAGAQVFALDYRLAPDHPFPAAPQDAIAAFRALVQRAPDFGIDPRRIAVAGDSAGGALAAIVAQACRADAVPPRFQMLWVPWVDLAGRYPSDDLFGTGFFLTSERLGWYRDHYLAGADAADPLASPITGDVAGVCPAAVMVAAFDPLRDQGRAYAARLKAAGVPVDLRVVAGVPHIMLNAAGHIPAAAPAMDDAAALIRQALA